MDMNEFLRESPIAARVRLPVRAVVGRGVHSLAEVRSIAESGSYMPAPGADRAASGAAGSDLGGFGARGAEAAELEASGVVLARGRVVRKGGRLFFKVEALGAEGEADR